MRSLITGGAGFIGSHLTEYLLDRGDEVVVLDDLSTGRLSNLDTVRDHSRFRFVEGSILDPATVKLAMAEADRVFHLAAAVGVHRIVERPLESLRTNLHGTEVVLEEALSAGAEVLLASTSEVYGKNVSDSLPETRTGFSDLRLASRWTYAAAKGLDEAIAQAYWREFGLQASIVRLFNTVGPRQTGRYGMVVPNLVGQALRGASLTVYGDGQQTRCFSYVTDVVPAMVAIQEAPESAVMRSTSAAPSRCRSTTWHGASWSCSTARATSCWCPTSRPTPLATKTCVVGCPTTRSRATWWASTRRRHSTRSSSRSQPRCLLLLRPQTPLLPVRRR